MCTHVLILRGLYFLPLPSFTAYCDAVVLVGGGIWDLEKLDSEFRARETSNLIVVVTVIVIVILFF